MRKTQEAAFLAELEVIARENRQLSVKRGMPRQMGYLVSVVASRPWQFLLGSSFLAVGVSFALSPLEFMRLVRCLLLME